MTVVTFSGYVPGARYDGRPWTDVRVEQSADQAGPFTAVETIPLAPVDTDPINPVERSFTTELATLDPGWYRAVFVDADLDEQITDPVPYPPDDGLLATVADITPTVDAVGALLHARTYAGGVEVGTFTAETAVTAAQVAELIQMAVADLRARVGTAIALGLAGEAKRLAALQAATLVEASFFPNELDTDRSAYRQYQAMYLSSVQALTDDARRPAALRLA